MNTNPNIIYARVCPYCKSGTKLVDSSVIYGRSFGPVYVCKSYPKCDAYVGCHRKGNRPLGRLANSELRGWKKKVHSLFDPLWRGGYMTRKEAYSWLSEAMDIHSDYCHIGMFDVAECKKAVKVIESKRSDVIGLNLDIILK